MPGYGYIFGPGRAETSGSRHAAGTGAASLAPHIPLRGEQLLSELPATMFGVPRAVAAGLLTPHYLAGWTNVVLGSFYAGSTLGGAPVDCADSDLRVPSWLHAASFMASRFWRWAYLPRA